MLHPDLIYHVRSYNIIKIYISLVLLISRRGGFLRLLVSGVDSWWTRPYGHYVRDFNQQNYRLTMPRFSATIAVSTVCVSRHERSRHNAVDVCHYGHGLSIGSSRDLAVQMVNVRSLFISIWINFHYLDRCRIGFFYIPWLYRVINRIAVINPNPTPFPGPQIPSTEPGLPTIPTSPPVPGTPLPDLIPGIVPEPVPAPIPQPIPEPVPETVPSPIPQTVPGPIPQTIPEPI